MKSLWLNLVLLSLCLFASLSGRGGNLYAQTYERMAETEQKLYGQRAFVSTDYDEMIAIKRYWYEESLKLKNRKYQFALTGSNDCVLKITIPASELFFENDSLLTNAADALLRPFLKHLRGSEAYAQVIVSTFSDNTGSEKYLKAITSGRSRNILKWMHQQGVDPTATWAYGFGSSEPVATNYSMRGRRENRRVVIYLVPNKNMVREAKKGKLGAPAPATVTKK